MAVERQLTTSYSGSASPSLINRPTKTNGDPLPQGALLVMSVFTLSFSSYIPATPTGWTPITPVFHNTGAFGETAITAFYKIVGSGEAASYSVAAGGGGAWAAAITAYTGAHLTTPIGTVAGVRPTGGYTSVSMPSQSVAAGGYHHLAYIFYQGALPFIGPTDYTTFFTDAGSSFNSVLSGRAITSGGAQGVKTGSLTGTVFSHSMGTAFEIVPTPDTAFELVGMTVI